MPVPTVSVVLPTWQSLAVLPAAIESILDQTFTDFELLVVDDGSSDGTRELIRSYECRDARVRGISLTHAGLVPALQEGIGQARGEFIARMDADDRSWPRRLAVQVEALRGNPEIGVVGGLVEFGGDRTTSAGYARHVDWINTVVTPEEIALSRFREAPLAHPSVMFRRQLALHGNGYREGDFPEDYECWLRWMEQGVTFAKVPEVVLTWNDPPRRLSRCDGHYAVEKFFRVKAHYLARWLAIHNPRHPGIMVIGAGRATRRRVDHLIREGIQVLAYADLDPRKLGRRYGDAPVIHHNELPGPGSVFVVPFVANTGAAELLRAMLENRGYRRGVDFIEAV